MKPVSFKILSIILTFSLFLSFKSTEAQNLFDKYYADSVIKLRRNLMIGVESGLYSGSMTALYFAWYHNYEQSSFHFFNDNDEWYQIDKIGHATTAAYMGKFAYEINRWVGLKRENAILLAGGQSLLYMSTIELLDGISAKWGASAGDIIANTSGVLLFTGQQYFWDEQRFLLKFSYHRSGLEKIYPERFGYSYIENTIKDYNGQTYWLSGNIHSFLPDNSRFPKWLNLAFGYSADNMLGAHPGPGSYRQYFLSMDVDLTRIPSNSQWLKTVLHSIGFIKIPFPALEYNKENQFTFHPLYF